MWSGCFFCFRKFCFVIVVLYMKLSQNQDVSQSSIMLQRERARESLQSSEVSHEPWPFLRFLLQLQISIFYLSPDIGPSCCQSHRKQSLSRQQHGCTVTGFSSGRRDCLQYIIASIAFSHSKCAEVLASFGIQSMVFAGAMETFMKRGKYPL